MIELSKKYRTRDGCKVRLYSVETTGEWSVHGAVYEDKVWSIRAWRKDGDSRGEPYSSDLIEVKPSAIEEMIAVMEGHKVSYLNSSAKAIAQAVDLLITEARRIRDSNATSDE